MGNNQEFERRISNLELEISSLKSNLIQALEIIVDQLNCLNREERLQHHKMVILEKIVISLQ